MLKVYDRHLHPSVYKKFNRTRELKEEGVDPIEFRKRGGLDEKTYEALIQRYKSQKQDLEDKKQNIISKYGSLKAAPLSTGPCKKIEPVIGTKNVLVLLTEFKDKKHTLQPGEIEQNLFIKGSKSMRDYYLEASWNQLDITGKVYNQWYSTPGNRSDYIDEAVEIKYPLSRKLVTETLLNAKGNHDLDFTPYARGGKIELLIVIFAGKGLDTALDVQYMRPHQGYLKEPLEMQKGIAADRYILAPELPLEEIGCYCHEMGHLLGLPDFYNMKSPVIGGWCVMSIGDYNDHGKTPAHPNAWCKVHLGWREPEVIEKPPELLDIPAVSDTNGKIYKMEVQGTGGREYFLLENRQQRGYDQKLPGSGLLIWHVDENRCVLQAPNFDFNNLFLTLIQSDGRKELQGDIIQFLKEKGYQTGSKEGYEAVMKEFIGDDGDPYPGITDNRNFDEKSNPQSISNKGTDSLVRVKSISDSDAVMKASMGIQTQGGIDEPTQTGTTKSRENEIAKLLLQKYIELMTKPEHKKPYDEGYEAGAQDKIEVMKEEQNLDSYTKGYRLGYHKGCKKALKRSKKPDLK